jgi:hypothetical protein
MSRETKVNPPAALGILRKGDVVSREPIPAGIVDGVQAFELGPLVVAREPDFRWSGRPVYRCRFCGAHYERVENLPAVLEHEAEAHPQIRAVRESRILGHDGKPLEVAEEE